MKKVIAIVLAAAMMLALIGCTSRKLSGVQVFVSKGGNDAPPVEDSAE